MKIDRLVIQNFKKFENIEFEFDQGTNIFVGDNESGKSTLLEAIEICLNCTIHGCPLSEELTVGLFNKKCVDEFLERLKSGTENKSFEDYGPPKIVIEAYLTADLDSELDNLKGSMNSKNEYTAGIRVEVKLSSNVDVAIEIENCDSLPVEFYTVKWLTFASDDLFESGKPVDSIFVEPDRLHPRIDRYINKILKQKLEKERISKINYDFRKLKSSFDDNENMTIINEIFEETDITKKEFKITTETSSISPLEDSLYFTIDQIPFTFVGKGEQNQVQIKLSLISDFNDKLGIVLIDELESHVSHSNLRKLINDIEKIVEDSENDKQLFITTHNSHVLNKLNIGKMHIMGMDDHTRLIDFDENTAKKINRLSSHDTLRIVLTQKAILVEGPSDELIVKRCYQDLHEGAVPEDNGIEVIAVYGLSFQVYLDIAKKIGTRTAVIVDNDGDYQRNVQERLERIHHDCNDIEIFATANDNLNTLEPTLLNENKSDLDELNKFANIVLSNAKNRKYRDLDENYDERLNFLEENYCKSPKEKVDFALEIFYKPEKINYPDHIRRAIEHVS